MKTRADIYGQEAADLLREISMYPGLSEGQLARFHPGREEKVRNLLAHLQRQGRIAPAGTGGYFTQGEHVRGADTSVTAHSGLFRYGTVFLSIGINQAQPACNSLPSRPAPPYKSLIYRGNAIRESAPHPPPAQCVQAKEPPVCVHGRSQEGLPDKGR